MRRMIDMAVMLLPQPLSPTTPTTWRRRDVEVDAIDGAHGAFVEGEVRFQVPDFQQDILRSGSVFV